MKISTKGRYGLRIMTDIAVYGKGGCVSLKDIAEREHLSEKYLEQIINLLGRENLVQSVRGAKGGYHLTKSPVTFLLKNSVTETHRKEVRRFYPWKSFQGTFSPKALRKALTQNS